MPLRCPLIGQSSAGNERDVDKSHSVGVIREDLVATVRAEHMAEPSSPRMVQEQTSDSSADDAEPTSQRSLHQTPVEQLVANAVGDSQEVFRGESSFLKRAHPAPRRVADIRDQLLPMIQWLSAVW